MFLPAYINPLVDDVVVGSDDKNHKVTFATLYGVDKAQKMAEKAVTEAKAALSSLKGDTVDLLWLADYLIGREY